MAQILILARLCDPSSELHIAERFCEASALSDLLGVPVKKVNEDRLYRALDPSDGTERLAASGCWTAAW